MKQNTVRSNNLHIFNDGTFNNFGKQVKQDKMLELDSDLNDDIVEEYDDDDDEEYGDIGGDVRVGNNEFVDDGQCRSAANLARCRVRIVTESIIAYLVGPLTLVERQNIHKLTFPKREKSSFFGLFTKKKE